MLFLRLMIDAGVLLVGFRLHDLLNRAHLDHRVRVGQNNQRAEK